MLAAEHLGLTEVPVIVVAGLTEAEKRIYLVADNQLGLNSAWDEKKLQVLIGELEKELENLDLTALRPQDRTTQRRWRLHRPDARLSRSRSDTRSVRICGMSMDEDENNIARRM